MDVAQDPRAEDCLGDDSESGERLDDNVEPPDQDLTPESAIRRAARAWLDIVEHNAHAEGEPLWIQLYLACHHCPEDAEDRVPLSHLKARHGLRDYHNRAKRLGITWVLGGFADPDAFSGTLLGQWLRGIGIAVTREHLSEIRAALKILCREALDRVKADGGC